MGYTTEVLTEKFQWRWGHVKRLDSIWNLSKRVIFHTTFLIIYNIEFSEFDQGIWPSDIEKSIQSNFLNIIRIVEIN